LNCGYCRGSAKFCGLFEPAGCHASIAPYAAFNAVDSAASRARACLPSAEGHKHAIWGLSRVLPWPYRVLLVDAHVARLTLLERDPLLAERLKRLRTVPGVGPITALTWALEIGDFTRFPSVKEAISYCGLCGDESSSADKVLRMPLSKQRNKYIQRTLIEAAKLATRYNHELAEVYEKERERGNANRATLAVARKLVAYLLAVDRRKQDFVPAEVFKAIAAA
jgi:hypothetical protein